MHMIDILLKKRNGGELTEQEISFLINGYVNKAIPEYQISSLLMAIFFQGMTAKETGILTRQMIDSGTVMDLSALDGPFVDKHSTGGVGDKVSLILAPVAAACGVQIPMMSGRSLGHTGGTLDKLESIPGYSTNITEEQFRDTIQNCGFSMIGQSDSVVPADRRLYALRDVTATVESIPLITSSILSKKFAEGAESLVFDVKTGGGAFMKTEKEALELAHSLVNTGKNLGRRIVAVLTRMDSPLGSCVGNFLEVEESLALLRCPEAMAQVPADKRSDDLMEVTLRLTAWMLVAGGIVKDVDEGMVRCQEALANGKAWNAMKQNIELQGGNISEMYRRFGTWRAPVVEMLSAKSAGVIQSIDAYKIGMAGIYLGVGRKTSSDTVYADAGFELLHKEGDVVQEGEHLLRIWGHTEEAVSQALRLAEDSIAIDEGQPKNTTRMILQEISTL